LIQAPESIGKAETRVLAAAYVRTFGQRNLPFISLWERVRGATIDIDALVPGSRVFAAESPVLLLSADSLASVRGQFGPFLVVHMFDGAGEPEVSVGVSAFSGDAPLPRRPGWPVAFDDVLIPLQDGSGG